MRRSEAREALQGQLHSQRRVKFTTEFGGEGTYAFDQAVHGHGPNLLRLDLGVSRQTSGPRRDEDLEREDALSVTSHGDDGDHATT